MKGYWRKPEETKAAVIDPRDGSIRAILAGFTKATCKLPIA
jgi:hypothetical protein